MHNIFFYSFTMSAYKIRHKQPWLLIQQLSNIPWRDRRLVLKSQLSVVG